MDLSSIGYTPKDFRVIPVHGKSLLGDFTKKQFRILAVECNARGSYSSPLQTRLKSIFPKLKEDKILSKQDRSLLGTVHLTDVHFQGKGHGIIANMFISSGYGLGRSGSNRGQNPVNRFSEKFLSSSFDALIEELRKRNINPDRQIAVQRFYGGLGGVEWEAVQAVLDAVCEKHSINILAYLPENYNTGFVRGSHN